MEACSRLFQNRSLRGSTNFPASFHPLKDNHHIILDFHNFCNIIRNVQCTSVKFNVKNFGNVSAKRFPAASCDHPASGRAEEAAGLARRRPRGPRVRARGDQGHARAARRGARSAQPSPPLLDPLNKTIFVFDFSQSSRESQ